MKSILSHLTASDRGKGWAKQDIDDIELTSLAACDVSNADDEEQSLPPPLSAGTKLLRTCSTRFGRSFCTLGTLPRNVLLFLYVFSA